MCFFHFYCIVPIICEKQTHNEETLGPAATTWGLFTSFGRHMGTSGLLEVIVAGLWQCSSSSFLEEQTRVLLGIYCPPTAHITSTGSTGLSPGIMISPDTVLGDKANLLATTHKNVPSRRRRRPNLGSFRGLCAIAAGEGSGKWKTNHQQKGCREREKRSEVNTSKTIP